jgi:hypothetical protein
MMMLPDLINKDGDDREMAGSPTSGSVYNRVPNKLFLRLSQSFGQLQATYERLPNNYLQQEGLRNKDGFY